MKNDRQLDFTFLGKGDRSVYLRAFDLLLSGNKFVDAQVNIIYMYVLTCISVVFFFTF